MNTILIHFAKPNFLRKAVCDVILIADNHPTYYEKLKYFLTIMAAFAPIAYVLNGVSKWLEDNQQFASFVLICIIINIVVGWLYHHKMQTFSWELFLKRTGLMVFVLICSYSLLEMMRITVGNNIIGDSFKAIIQVSTLLYPMSKALKNLYILSNKQFPPKFLMERLYNFEKSGNINDLIDNK